jgi:plasmid stabilization system protein ParE
MPARSVQFIAAARDEVREALDWYQARSDLAAARFLAEVERAAGLIRETPDVWLAFDGDTHRYLLHGFPYSVIYREFGDIIQVLAVAHHKRRPGYWKLRAGAERLR